MNTPRIKICCTASLDEANAALEAGASAIGLVSAMPSGPGPIPIEQIAEIVRGLPPTTDTFLLTCERSADKVIAQLKQTRCTTIQLCDAIDEPSTYAAIRAAVPGVRIVQVIHVEDELALDEAFQAQHHADALLLDSGRPNAKVKELGGTGRAHDWTLSRRIVGTATVPVWLAGGLTPANVAQAIRDVGPHGLDVCSGVRTDGKLDATKLKAFIAEAQKAAAISSPPNT